MRRDVLRLVRRWGREVSLLENGVETLGMAILQPLGDREEKWLPTALGRRGQGRMLILCEPGLAPQEAGEDARLLCGEERYRIVTAQPVCMGEDVLFCRAVLWPEDEEV